MTYHWFTTAVGATRCDPCRAAFDAMFSALGGGKPWPEPCHDVEEFKAKCTAEVFDPMGYTRCPCPDCDKSNCPAEFVVAITYDAVSADWTPRCELALSV